MTIADETLMAYIDGELEPQSRAAVEAAIASDPDVKRRVEQQRALRHTLRMRFDAVLDEPVPQRLIAAAENSPAAASSPPNPQTVTELKQTRKRIAGKIGSMSGRRPWPVWAAMAASLVLGLAISQAFLRSPGDSPFVAREGQLVAQGKLAAALTNQLTNRQRSDTAIQIGLSFRDKSGDYCRTFVLRSTDALAGLACRDAGHWTLQVLARAEKKNVYSEAYRPASTELPRSILRAVEEQIDGEPLDPAAEAAAQRNNWSAPKP